MHEATMSVVLFVQRWPNNGQLGGRDGSLWGLRVKLNVVAEVKVHYPGLSLPSPSSLPSPQESVATRAVGNRTCMGGSTDFLTPLEEYFCRA